MKLKKGVYENLISKEVAEDIQRAEENNMECVKTNIDSAESPALLAQYLSKIIQNKLDDKNFSNDERTDFVNSLMKLAQIDDKNHIDENKLLAEVKDATQIARSRATGLDTERPLSGFRVSSLFTGGNSELSIGSELKKDIMSSDKIYIIVSFLRLSGLHLIYDALKDFCSQEGHELKVITTTYCGITEAKAVEQLSLLPRTEIHISYNTKVERLHAKSYIFERNSGYSTAYIGSSNLSKSAQTDGLEWNIRVTNVENPHIIKTALATFEMYWNSPNFEDYKIGGIKKFSEETHLNRFTSSSPQIFQHFEILPHQKAILDKLLLVRENGITRNLIVAATGTGKTVISAFDYRQFMNEHPEHHRLLFIAHREEILSQSLLTYRSVLRDANFGDLWVGDHRPEKSIDHLFVSVQTFNSHFNEVFAGLSNDYYDYIVIDEAHHSVASSYRKIFDHFKPLLLIGLTATPERMDGSSLLDDFGKISAEIRLPKALDEGLLTPFQYYCISDNTDLTDECLWMNGKNGKYIISKLSERLCNISRTDLIIDRLNYYLSDEHKCKALCFCTDKNHAKFMADQFNQCGFKSDYLVSDNSEKRTRLNHALACGEINYLFVVDMFNEGVDIPSVDTVLFLRPTESLTIFLQQLGRGLRLDAGKNLLTVLDFVAQVNINYDFTSRFRALLTKTGTNVEDQIRHGFTLLPHGCSIQMEEKAQKYVLQCINSAIYTKNKLIAELQSYAITPTLGEFIAGNGQDVRIIYKNGLCWSLLKKMANKCTYDEDKNTKHFEKGVGLLTHINSLNYLKFIKKTMHDYGEIHPHNKEEETFALMLYYALYQETISNLGVDSIYKALSWLKNYPIFVQEIYELADYLIANLSFKTDIVGAGIPESMEVYGCYTREEVFCMLGKQTPNKKMQGSVAGVFNVEEYNTELFFVTLNKSDKDFSPTTQYDDYIISEKLFHWQSQNTDSHNGKGERFVNQATNHKRFLIFVREYTKDEFGNTSPFLCFGFANYVSSSGDYPMNIVWKMEKPIMAQFIKAV